MLVAWLGMVGGPVFALEGWMSDREPAKQSKHQPRPSLRPVAQVHVHPDQLKGSQIVGREAARQSRPMKKSKPQ